MTTPLQNIALKKIDGSASSLADYAGKATLIVNVASQCGLTPQYAALEALYRQHKDAGLVVLGFPANNFKQQEPGTEAEIASFCSTTYDVTFPLFSKISVVGADTHPLYQALTQAQPHSVGSEPFRERLQSRGITLDNESDVLWNFEKFLVNGEGQVVARFAPNVTPDDPQVIAAIEKLLN